MTLPQIVGQHQLIEINSQKESDPWATGNITAFAGTAGGHRVHTRSTALNSPGSSGNIFQGPLLTFQAGESLSWGRFIDGAHSSDNAQRYVICGALEAKFNTNAHGITCSLLIGKLDSGGVTVNYTGQPNLISHGIPLAANVRVADGMIHASAMVEVIDGKFDRAIDFTSLPIAAYWALTQDSGGPTGMAMFRASISIYNFKRPLDVFDPRK